MTHPTTPAVSHWGRVPTPALHGCVWIGVLSAAASVAFLRPELALVALPLLVLATTPYTRPLPAAPELTVTVDRQTALEGEEIEVVVRGPVRWEGLRVRLNDGGIGVLVADGDGAASAVMVVPCRRWGSYRVGVNELWQDDALGLARIAGQVVGAAVEVRVYPPALRTRALLRAMRTTPLVGELLARRVGDGVEFASIRPFQPGDRARSLNWRATAKRGEPMVTERHVEHNADVVLFVDTFTEHATDDDGTSDDDHLDTSLDLAVRGADALARGHARQRDRVGLVFVGGRMQWVRPGFGIRHVYRIAAALLDAEVGRAAWWPGIDVIPRQTIPAGAFVIALSPLVDPRVLDALAGLRTRGHDVAVVDVLPALLAGRGENLTAAAQRREVAGRLFELRRRAAIARLRAIGVGVASWQPGAPLDLPLLQLQSFRRNVARRT